MYFLLENAETSTGPFSFHNSTMEALDKIHAKEQEILELMQTLPEQIKTQDLKQFEQDLLKFFVETNDIAQKSRKVELKYRNSDYKKLEIMNEGMKSLHEIL